MIDLLPVILALGLGLVIGAWAGAVLAIRRDRRRRATLNAQAGLARLWPGAVPVRSAQDILAGVVVVTLGGTTYRLPVLPRGVSRRWLESLDARFAWLSARLDAAADDTPAILAMLVAETDGLYEMLRSYDAAGAGLLPPREAIDETTTDTEILRAVLEVWQAANPLAATLAGPRDDETDGTSSAPRSTRPRPTGGAPSASSPSPTSSSSATSTPPMTASSGR